MIFASSLMTQSVLTGITESVSLMKFISKFKSPTCILSSGKTIPLYDEGKVQVTVKCILRV